MMSLYELLLLIGISGALWFLFIRISHCLGFAEPATVFTEKIQSLLPQTQCGQCQYSGCRPYADNIACDMAQINRCPPGGDTGVATLADYLGRPVLPLFQPELCVPEKQIAFIDEQRCIGCTLCIKACPVDAIIGAARQMHTVINSQCNGCRLCIAPCPVDCITMHGTGDRGRP